MQKSPIPEAILSSHTAVLGKTGSGKTSTAKLIVEQVVAAGARVCILDPIKSDWWGLISSADGRRPGLPFKILGGPHGHVPLHASAGKAIGEIVASGKLPLSIIDMADFEPGGTSKFFIDFAAALLRRSRGVIYLVIEEAHEFAPKERSGIGAENMAIHYAKKLATAGRSKGIRMIVVTQRTQSLHNAILGSCETLITHRFTTPADQEPVVKWLKANVEKPLMERVASSLSSIPTGSGWICSGEAKVFELVQFPRIQTYDNSATPTDDDVSHDVKSAPVDQSELRSIIGDAVKEAEANDPKALRAEVATLKKQLAGMSSSSPSNEGAKINTATINQEAVDRARRDGYAEGHIVGAGLYHVSLKYVADHVPDIVATIVDAITGRVSDAITDTINQRLSEAEGICQAQEFTQSEYQPKARTSGTPIHATAYSAPSHAAKPVVPASKGTIRASAPRPEGLTGPQAKLLEAIAWWSAMGHDRPTRAQIAAKVGWKAKGSNLKDRLSELSNAGLVTYPTTGLVALTPAGRAIGPSPDVSETLHGSIRDMLTGPQCKLFDVLVELGGEATPRATIAERVGWEPGGSNLKDRLSELNNMEIVEYPKRGEVALAEWVRNG